MYWNIIDKQNHKIYLTMLLSKLQIKINLLKLINNSNMIKLNKKVYKKIWAVKKLDNKWNYI